MPKTISRKKCAEKEKRIHTLLAIKLLKYMNPRGTKKAIEKAYKKCLRDSKRKTKKQTKK